MALKTKVTEAEFQTLPDDHRAAYRAGEAGDYVVDLEGIGDVGNLFSAHERQKREAAELKARLSLAKDATPESFADLQQRLDQSQAEIDAIPERQRKLEEAHAAELKALDEKIAAMQRDLADLREDEVARYAARQIESAIEGAGGDYSTQRLLGVHVADMVRATRNGNGEIEIHVLDRTGQRRLDANGLPVSVETLAHEIRALDSVLSRAFPNGGNPSNGKAH